MKLILLITTILQAFRLFAQPAEVIDNMDMPVRLESNSLLGTRLVIELESRDWLYAIKGITIRNDSVFLEFGFIQGLWFVDPALAGRIDWEKVKVGGKNI